MMKEVSLEAVTKQWLIRFFASFGAAFVFAGLVIVFQDFLVTHNVVWLVAFIGFRTGTYLGWWERGIVDRDLEEESLAGAL